MSKRRPSSRRLFERGLALLLVVALSPAPALAQQATVPQGAQVVNGSATITTPDATTLAITQTSSRAIIDWRDFSIGAGHAVNITQPGAAAALLNRVTGGNLSLINGQLTANGKVYLINPQGVVVGPSGRIDTAAFIGSTLNTSNEDFLAGGPVRFAGDSTAGVINLGTIRTAAGDVVIIAAKVANAGAITAANGAASLLSGSEVLYVPGGTGSLVIKAPAAADGVAIENSGSIAAAEVALRAAGSAHALAVKSDGVISATSLTREGGRIILDGGAGTVSHTGSLRATAGDGGGRIDVTGSHVDLTGAAVVDASGETAGGTVRIGGGYRGRDSQVANASTTAVGEGVTIRANATGAGNGGVISVWADERTTFAGSIEATGASAGDGGRADVSAPVLGYTGIADLRAPNGKTGNLSLDPGSFLIDAGQAATIQTNLNGANVSIDGYDDITVSAPVVNNTTTNTLTLDATDIFVNANLSLAAGTIQFGSSFTSANSVTSLAGASISANEIWVASAYASVNFAGPIIAPGNGLTIGTPLAGGAATSFTANNAGNQLGQLKLPSAEEVFTGSFDVRSSVAMHVTGEIEATGNVTIVSSGNLTFDNGGSGTKINAAGTTTLASTGGVINTNAALTLTGAGRKRLYSSTSASPFNVSGLPYPQVAGVSFSNDPQGGNVIYIAAATALPVLTVTADNKSAVYGGFAPTYTASFSGGSASDLTSPVQFRLDRSLRDAGTYSIIPFGALSGTHSLSFVNGTLTVTPAPLLISGPAVSSPYGSAIPAFTPQYSGFVLGDGPRDVFGLALATPATSQSPVGAYPIVPSGASAHNYSISYANGMLTITPAVLRVIANSASRLYGGLNPVFSARFEGLQNGDSPQVVNGLSFSTAAVENSPVGAYPIAVSGGAAANYQLQLVPGTLTVNRAPLAVTTSGAAVTYGRPVPTLATTVNGLVAGDTVQSLGIASTTSVVPGFNVGTYTTSLAGSFSNYDVNYTPGVITVSPAGLSLTANGAKRFQYQQNPLFTGTVSGLFGSDQVAVTYTTTADAASPAGAYLIVPHAEPNPNYFYITVPAFLTVEQQPSPVLQYDHEQFQQQMENMKELKIDIPETRIVVKYAGHGLNSLYYEAGAVVTRALAEYDKLNDSPSAAELKYLMSSNKMGDNYQVGKLMPFLIGEASAILDRPEASWTAQERAFIDYMTTVVSQQRKKAAEDSLAELNAYKRIQKGEVQAQGVGSLIELPEVPPKSFLEQAEAGVNVNLIEGGAVAGMIGAAATLAVGAAGVAVGTGAAATAVAAIMPFVGVAAGKAAMSAAIASGAATSAALAAKSAAVAGAAAGATVGVVVGAVLIVVLAVAGIIVSSVQVANATEYDAKMAAAVANAAKPITASDLKAMLSDTKGKEKVYTQLLTHIAGAATK